MTLNDIEVAIYRRTGYADMPAPEVVTRIRQWINLWHQRLLARPGIELLREIQVTVPSVAGQPTYLLPTSIRRVNKVFEQQTPTTLRMERQDWLREHDPGDRAIGIPEVWCPSSWSAWDPPTSQLMIRLWPTPAQIILYVVDTQGLTADLVASTEVPTLPLEYHWLLVEAACYEEWMRKADTRSGTARQDLETGFKEMRNWLSNLPDYKPTNLPQAYHPSRLGGWYPHW
jgi:hypothetical protein